MACAILFKNQLTSVTSFRNTGQRAVLKFAAATAATPPAARFTPRTFTDQTLAASRGCFFWWSPIPGLTTSLSWRCCVLTHQPLCSVHRFSSVPCGHWHPCSKKEAHSVGLRRWMLPGKFCMHVVPTWVHTYGRSHLISASIRGLERQKRMSSTCWEGHKEEHQGARTTPAPKFMTTPPEVTDGSLCACPAGPVEDGSPQPPLWTGLLVYRSQCSGDWMDRNNHLVVLSYSSLGSYTETRNKISRKQILKKKKKKDKRNVMQSLGLKLFQVNILWILLVEFLGPLFPSQGISPLPPYFCDDVWV